MIKVKPIKLLNVFVCLFVMTWTVAGQEFILPVDPPPASYVIEGTIRIAGNQITVSGKEILTFKNTTSHPISVLAFRWRIDSDRTIEIRWDGTPLKLLNPEKGLRLNTPLFYQLPKVIKPKRKVKLEIDFSVRFKGETEQIGMQRWHPTLWWEDIPTQDVYQVKMDIPADYTMAISGRLKRSGFYVNRSVTTNFGLVLFKDIEKAEQEVEGIQITALFTPEGEKCARQCLETAADVIKFYTDWHGFYPCESLYIIPGAAEPWGGYPYASGIVVIHGQQKFDTKPLLHWQWITAHEIGHQYWGEYVMSKDIPSDYTDSWLMIGMGICADRAYTLYRNLGDEKHQAFFNRYLEGVKNRHDTTADAPESLLRKQKYDRNNVLIHGKGYSILSALESVLGKEVFADIYMACVKKYGGKRLGYRDFWDISEKESGQNLDWFFESWVRSPSYLCYKITSQKSSKQGDNFISEIVVERMGDSLSMPIPMEVIFADGSTQRASTDRFLKRNILRFNSQSQLESAVLDPEHKLAMLQEPLALLPEDLPEAISRLPWSGSADDGLRLYNIAVEAKLDIVSSWFKLGMTIFEGGYLTEAFDAFKRMIDLKPAKNYHFYALIWMGNVLDAQGKREEAIKFYRESLKYDTGGGTRHDQFKIESSRKWVEERLKSPYDWKTVTKK